MVIFYKSKHPEGLRCCPLFAGDEIEAGKDWYVVKSQNTVTQEQAYGLDSLVLNILYHTT